jgi:hypothetical protein
LLNFRFAASCYIFAAVGFENIFGALCFYLPLLNSAMRQFLLQTGNKVSSATSICSNVIDFHALEEAKMFEDLAELLLGPLGLAALIVFGASRTSEGRRILKEATRGIVKAGYIVAEKSSDLIAEVKEQTSDLIAEAKAENGAHTKAKPKTAKS